MVIGDLKDLKNGPGEKYYRHSIRKLRLNLEEATAGRTWLLLPEGFRSSECGSTYPLPCRRLEVQQLAGICIPAHKKDAGTVYLRRAVKKWKELQKRAQSAVLDVGRRSRSIEKAQWRYTQDIKGMKRDAEQAVAEVQVKAAESIASLTDLFSLGRKGIAGMMQAHLDGTEWQGERIKAIAFRDCFRMVTQAVKGLGLPSDQRDKATKAVMAEAAAALKDTREVVDLAADDESETTPQ